MGHKCARRWLVCLVLSTLPLLVLHPLFASEPATLLVGFDGAYAVQGQTSATAIEQGLRIAIAEINAAGGVLGGRRFELLTTDNRMVPARGVANLRELAGMENMIAVFGGRFSPVITEQIAVAQELKMILLDVWGAADEITEHGYSPDYVFRLSLKDSWAMPAMVRHAKSIGAKRLGLLVPNHSWGRSTYNALLRLPLGEDDPAFVAIAWYNWSEKDMLRHFRKVREAGGEAIVLVAGEFGGSRLVRQMTGLPRNEWLPIISHWGVTGGRMAEESGDHFHEVDFSVVQTFNFRRARPGPLEHFARTAKKLFQVEDVAKLPSPVGYAHAYDLMHILAGAVELAASADREKIRAALERVRNHDGLVRHYDRPFTPTNHDALDAGAVFMARYDKDSSLVPIH